MSLKEDKKSAKKEKAKDPFWSRMLIFTIIIIWVALMGGNWAGHYVIKSGIFGKQSANGDDEFKGMKDSKPKVWKQQVKPQSPEISPVPQYEDSIKKDISPNAVESNENGDLKIEEDQESPEPKQSEAINTEKDESISQDKSASSPAPRKPTKSEKNVQSEPAASASKSAKIQTETYSLQVGNYEKDENARDLANQLKGEGQNATVVKENGMFKVYVGNYKSLDKAREDSEKLKNQGFDSFVVNKASGKQ